MTPPEKLFAGPGYRLARAVEGVLIGLAPLGLVFVITGLAALGVALFAIGTIGATFVHLAVGIGGYRRAMHAEWPKVDPVEDDDW
jgi:hypothetical protein